MMMKGVGSGGEVKRRISRCFLPLQIHEKQPFTMDVGGEHHEVSYVPGESNTYVFGGNSNWRGPIWLCGELNDKLSSVFLAIWLCFYTDTWALVAALFAT